MSRTEHNAHAWLAQAAEIKRARDERAKLLALGAQRKQRDTRETEQRMAARRLGFTS
jgi:hypothetical protein